jgi:hypothetical protein
MRDVVELQPWNKMERPLILRSFISCRRLGNGLKSFSLIGFSVVTLPLRLEILGLFPSDALEDILELCLYTRRIISLQLFALDNFALNHCYSPNLFPPRSDLLLGPVLSIPVRIRSLMIKLSGGRSHRIAHTRSTKKTTSAGNSNIDTTSTTPKVPVNNNVGRPFPATGGHGDSQRGQDVGPSGTG